MADQWAAARKYFTDDLVSYMERVAGVPWPTCLVRFMTYRDGAHQNGPMRPRYNQPARLLPVNKVRERDRELWTRDQVLRRVRAMAIAGVKRDLAAAEEEIKRLRDLAQYQREFGARAEERA